MSSRKERASGGFWREMLNAISGRSQPPQKSGSRFQGTSSGGELEDEVISFGDFIAMRLPEQPPTSLAKNEVIQKFASNIAEKVRDALSAAGIESYSLIEFYMPVTTEGIIRRFFVDRDPNGLKQFERICEGIIFGPGVMNSISGKTNAPRVYVVRQPLAFHPDFDPILKKRLIVRPLGVGNTPIPINPSDADYDSDQLLIGLFQVYEPGGVQPLDEAPIWVWRSKKEQNSIRIDVDFDLLSRAFSEAYWHKFPLGLAIRCSFRTQGGARAIESVTMDISGVKRWIDYLKEAKGEEASVVYEANVGEGGGRYDLRKHTLDTIDLVKEREKGDFLLGTDEQGNERKIPVNRVFSMRVASSDKSYVYNFGFFERALNYVPARNIMRVTGQLIPANEPVVVMLPPGGGDDQEPVFRLTPDPGRLGHFKLSLIKSVTFDLTLNNGQSLSYGSAVDVQIDDTIKAVPRAKPGGRVDEYEFRIQALTLIPDEVCNREDRPYSAFVDIGSPVWRQYVLHDKEHVFGAGAGRGFHESAYGISADALKFKRPWVSLAMLPGKDQEVLFYNKSARATGPGKRHAQVLPKEGRELDLNADYEVYVGDFQITLILKATPSSTFL